MILVGAILLTIVLLVTALEASLAMGVNLYLAYGLVLALWAVRDADRVRLRDYRTQLAVPPLVLGLLMTLLWPVFLPWYLHVRHRIGKGRLTAATPDKRPRRLGLVAMIAIGAVGLSGSDLGLGFRDVADGGSADMEEVLPVSMAVGNAVANALDPQALGLTGGGEVTLDLDSEGVLTIEIPAAAETDSEVLEDAGYRAARAAVSAYSGAEPLREVVVGFWAEEKYGPVKLSRWIDEVSLTVSPGPP